MVSSRTPVVRQAVDALTFEGAQVLVDLDELSFQQRLFYKVTWYPQLAAKTCISILLRHRRVMRSPTA
jgi:hypothetical protein